MNISSLQLHIDELRTLLKRVNFPFDVIGISETRLPYGEKPQTDIEIPGYEIFTHTTSKTNCGGLGLYIKSGKFKKIKPRPDMCMSIQNVAKAHFVEATDLRNKKIIFGVIYRHPNTDIDNFSSEVIGKITSTITKEKRECILMGDFHINLLNHQSDAATADFFNTLSAALFQPLILQPTRVTSHSKTLIDNIFINKLEY